MNKKEIKLNKLKEMSINHIIIENKKIIKKYESKSNSFLKHISSVFELISINNKLESLCNKLRIMNSSAVDKILDEFDEIICKYEY